MTEAIHQEKMAKAYTILSNGDRPSQIDDETYTVPSQSGNWLYDVKKQGENWFCTCPSHSKLLEARVQPAHCKHIYTVQFWLNLKDELREEVKDSKPQSFHACDKCGSHDIVKNGSRKTKQGKKTRLLCKLCNHTFVLEDDGFNDMKFDSEIVTLALDLYFKGTSLRKVAHHIEQFRGIKIDHTTIYKWIKKYSKIVSSYIDTLKPELGDTWNADEMMVKVRQEDSPFTLRGKARYVWLWNCMDADTRFLIANQVTTKRGLREARNLFRNAKNVSGKKPSFIVTDKLQAYKKGIRKELGWRKDAPIHVSDAGISDIVSNNLVERLNSTVRQREKVMRGIQNVDTSDALMGGYRVHYNFVRPHMALDGQTPAEKAKIDLALGDNKWLGLIKKSVENMPSTAQSTPTGQQTLNGWYQP